MNKGNTILFYAAFFLFGAMLATIGPQLTPNTEYKSVKAATIPHVAQLPGINAVLPHDLSLDLAKNESPNNMEQTATVVDSFAIDSLKQRIIELEKNKRQVTKVKWRQAPAPDPMVVRDTIRETHYYLATQTGSRENDDGICIPIYEIRKVDKICPEIIISSNGGNPNYSVDVGD